MAETLKVMVSSTSLDLPEHRGKIRDACLHQDMLPLIMESLPAKDEDAIRASLKMVDEADIYLAVLGYRYGYVPQGKDILSLTVLDFTSHSRTHVYQR